MYEIEMHVHNTLKQPGLTNSRTSTNNFVKSDDVESIKSDDVYRKPELGLFRRVKSYLLKEDGDIGKAVTVVNGDDEGVAFFLHFSVHGITADPKEGEDTRILPVHYSDNYFSLVPGEVMQIKMSFEVPRGVSPRVTLNGWNYHSAHIVH